MQDPGSNAPIGSRPHYSSTTTVPLAPRFQTALRRAGCRRVVRRRSSPRVNAVLAPVGLPGAGSRGSSGNGSEVASTSGTTLTRPGISEAVWSAVAGTQALAEQLWGTLRPRDAAGSRSTGTARGPSLEASLAVATALRAREVCGLFPAAACPADATHEGIVANAGVVLWRSIDGARAGAASLLGVLLLTSVGRPRQTTPVPPTNSRAAPAGPAVQADAKASSAGAKVVPSFDPFLKQAGVMETRYMRKLSNLCALTYSIPRLTVGRPQARGQHLVILPSPQLRDGTRMVARAGLDGASAVLPLAHHTEVCFGTFLVRACEDS